MPAAAMLKDGEPIADDHCRSNGKDQLSKQVVESQEFRDVHNDWETSPRPTTRSIGIKPAAGLTPVAAPTFTMRTRGVIPGRDPDDVD
jgi:hypothetical protein